MKRLVILFSFFLALSIMGYGQTYYYQSGGNVTLTGKSYSSSITDTSGVLVTNSGIFTLSNSTVTTTGNSSNTGNSSQYGTNAGVLASLAGTINFTGNTVTTSGTGANGLFATGAGSSVTMTNGSITTGNTLAHGVDVTYTGTITLNNVNITTTGPSSSALATDFGGGTVNVTGGTIIAADTSSGSHSAGIYSTGTITVSGASVTSGGDNGAVIDADGIIHLTNTSLAGAQNGLMIHKTVPGSPIGVFTIDGGDAFYITGATGSISVSGGATMNASTGNILNTVSSGSTIFMADGELLTGNIVCDNTSTSEITLMNSSTLSGSINTENTASSVSLTMDLTSSLDVNATSYVPVVSDPAGISGDSVTNITGNGHNVIYDGTLSANSYLGAKSYKLRNGGLLTCPTCTLGLNNLTTNTIPVKCFPNPANTVLNILINDPIPQKVSVFNIYGVKILECTVTETAAIDISNWENGSYFFSVNNKINQVIIMH